MSEDEQEFDIS